MQAFSTSSHAKRWIVSSTDGCNEEDRLFLTRDEILAIKINYINVLHTLGRQIRLRQVVTATAMTYFWRFYLKNSFSSYREWQSQPYHHPDFITPTCLTLACKVQECPLEKSVLASALAVVRNNPNLHFGLAVGNDADALLDKIHENEFLLMEALNADLIVFHPFQDVVAFIADFADHCSSPVSSDQVSELTRLAWAIASDSYRSDACLKFPPHDIALAAVMIATAKLKLTAEAGPWWRDLNYNLNRVREAVQFIMKNAYQQWAKVRVDNVRTLCSNLYTAWSAKAAENRQQKK